MVRLGWLIHPDAHRVEIYRPSQTVDVLQAPEQLSGESVLPGFELRLGWLWQAN
ncbi:Uma2 family endonuclease [Leptolyngbya sp. AN02str]|uniref:Uma2 family endonuclease n=1 Tax=Leptolyngbya sp. AN02str TaxID=3423363 RepID=UPI003D31CAD9